MNNGNKIHILEALRAFASIAVCLFHFSIHYEGGIFSWFQRYGWLGVDVFFVITGFIISYSISRQSNKYFWQIYNFFLLRLARIYPAYILSLIVVIVLWNASWLHPDFKGTEPKFDIGQFTSHMLLIVHLTGDEWLNPAYWTLAYEFAFYIVIVLTYPYWKNARSIDLSVFLVLSLIAAIFLLKLDVRFIAFAIGFLLFKSDIADYKDKFAFYISILLLLVVMIYFGKYYESYSIAFTCIIILLLKNIVIPNWILSLGAWSYSLYLLHIPIGSRIINYSIRFDQLQPYFEMIQLAALFISLSFAALCYKYVELPVNSLARRHLIKT